MGILSEAEWARLKAALDAARSGTGRPFPDERRTVEAVVWRQRNGAKWRAVPPEFGPWWKAAQLHIRWSRAGVWERAFALLRGAGRPDLGEVFLDGTSIRAHQKAAGAKGGRARTPSAARAAATAPRRASPATRGAARSASRSCPAKPRS
jgi:transposase